MKVVIIGWYGTETIGDRAILAGLFHILSQNCNELFVKIGCLDTLLTERTIDEDYIFYKRCSGNSLKNISLFDSRLKRELNEAVDWADILIIGGGPLMEIEAMYMLQYAFKRGKEKRKKNVIAGCGLGPFKTKELLELAIDIIDNSDVAIFRDKISYDIYQSVSHKCAHCSFSIDPAVFAAQCYLNFDSRVKKSDYIAINFRKPPTKDYFGLEKIKDDFFVRLLRKVSGEYGMQMQLVPMHTFYVGDDDRHILNKINQKAAVQNILVHNKPLSLEDTMRTFACASYCFGMRFHSVLLQTILNGRNFVIDYTDPAKGKIIGLLQQLDIYSFLANRYINIVNCQDIDLLDFRSVERISVEKEKLRGFMDTYVKNLYILSAY